MFAIVKRICVTLILIPALYASTAAQETSLLWKIEGNGLESPSYLYGTMHLICGEDFVMAPEVTGALKQSSRLALEIDISDPEIMQKMMQLSVNPDGSNIKEYIREENREQVDAFFTTNYGAGLEQLGTMRPIALTSMVLMALLECEDEIQSYDGYLMTLAKKHEIEVSALETVEFQYGLFDEIPLDDQVDELVRIIIDPEEGRDEFRKMVETYLSQDIYTMYALVTEDEFWETYRDLLLYERNRAWIPEIARMSAEETVFYAVGAGHLAGDYGVINLLRNEGYTLTPVKIEM